MSASNEQRPLPDRNLLLAIRIVLTVDATAAEVIGAFRRAGVRSIVLKGPSLARWLYEPESTRISADVDLLVAPPDRVAAEHALASLGFKPFPTNVVEDRYALPWSRRGNPVYVDLHLTLLGVNVSNEKAWDVLSRETDEMTIGGVSAAVLAPPARAMHVALHAAQHGARFERPLEDLRRALAQLPLEVWRDAADLASELEAEPMFAAGLGLLVPGKALLRTLGFPERKTVETVEVALLARSPPHVALGLHRLTTLPGLFPKAAFVARKLVPPPEWMRAWLPLARRGTPGLLAG